MDCLYIVMSTSPTLDMLAVLRIFCDLNAFQTLGTMAEVEERLERERIVSQLDVHLRKWGFSFSLFLGMLV